MSSSSASNKIEASIYCCYMIVCDNWLICVSIKERAHKRKHKRESTQTGTKLGLVIRGVTLLLVLYRDLATKDFFFFLFDFDACCWARTIILFEIFKKAALFVLDKIGLLDLIFFNFTIGNFCYWANFFGHVYFVLNFKFIDFFYGL